VPDNLEQAVENITKAERKIDSSIHILKGQTIFLDSIIRINEDLLTELDSLKQTNDEISTSINKKLNTAKLYLQKIKADIEKFPDNFDDIQ
jgi:seryl-tRNA synthetase